MSATILCVDDNPRNLRIMRELLEDDYPLECASSGEEALERAAKNPPALVLLDVMLPGVDGYEVCRRLRSEPGTASTPVVLVTAKARDVEKKEGLQAGADAYLLKPFDPDALLDLVEAYVAHPRPAVS